MSQWATPHIVELPAKEAREALLRAGMTPAGALALPEPLIGPEVDVRDLDGFMLNVERLMSSELVALSSPAEIAAALLLWCRAWKQIPAASLPNDDRILAAFSKNSEKKFKKIKNGALHGFVLCCDNRLYHRVLVEEAKRSFKWKESAKNKRLADNERLRKWRLSQRETADETSFDSAEETHNETSFVAIGQDRTYTTIGDSSLRSESKKTNTSVFVKKTTRHKNFKTKIQERTEPTESQIEAAIENGLTDTERIAEWGKFKTYNRANGAMFADWDAAWRLWLAKLKRSGPRSISTSRAVQQVSELIFIKEDTPQWSAWVTAWKKSHGGRSPPKTQREGTMERGWYFPAEYPPSE
jgi:hypothetical protein